MILKLCRVLHMFLPTFLVLKKWQVGKTYGGPCRFNLLQRISYVHIFLVCLLSKWKDWDNYLVQLFCGNKIFFNKFMISCNGWCKKNVTNTFNHKKFYTQTLTFLFILPKNRHFKLSIELLWVSLGHQSPGSHQF